MDISSGEQLQYFINRDEEQAVVRDYLNVSDSTPLPVVMFYGVGGLGKTWLIKRFRAICQEEKIPCALLDFNTEFGRSYYIDSSTALVDIRNQLGVDAPHFDLAYAMLRYKRSAGNEPRPRNIGENQDAWELIKEIIEAALHDMPAGNLIAFFTQKFGRNAVRQLQESPFGQRFLSIEGKQDLRDLHFLLPQDIYLQLAERMGKDLEIYLPSRPGKACRAVILFDTFDELQISGQGTARQNSQDKWVRELNFKNILLIITGRDRLKWGKLNEWRNSNRLKQYPLGGLSREDAQALLGWRGVQKAPLQRAILDACVDVDTVGNTQQKITYHPYSLSLCAYAVANEIKHRKEPDPQTFSMAPGDYDALAECFLRSLYNPAFAKWVLSLALTPRFDEIAAKARYGLQSNMERDANWEELSSYSFVLSYEAQGWRTLHARMRDSLRVRASGEPEVVVKEHTWWWEHWRSRQQSETDDFAALAWYHWFRNDPKAAFADWKNKIEKVRGKPHPDMELHYHLLDWWIPTGIENSKFSDLQTASILNELGRQLGQASLGVRSSNLLRAINCFEASLRVFTEIDHAADWAKAQNSLGNAYRGIQTGKRAENLSKAFDCYNAALRVFSETHYPEDWAKVQNNLGNAYRDRRARNRMENLSKAFDCYNAALRVYHEAKYPMEWAWTQNNLGNAYRDLRKGNRREHLSNAINCFEASLRIFTETDHATDWARTQISIGNAYRDLPMRNRVQNIIQAIEYYSNAVRIFNETEYPADWAILQISLGHSNRDLGNAYRNLKTNNPAASLDRAIGYYKDALRVFTEGAYPSDWASIQLSLGNAYRDLTSLYGGQKMNNREEVLDQAIRHFEGALRVFTETEFAEDWARTQNSMGNACRDLGNTFRDRNKDKLIKNIERAVDCHNAAQRIFTEADYPLDWARTQNSLGNAYCDLSYAYRSQNLEEHTKNVMYAIAYYEDALRVFTEAEYSEDWAWAQSNLANAYRNLRTGNRKEHLIKAKDYYEVAQRIFTEKEYPLEWAKMQNNIGNLLRDLAPFE